MLITIQTSRHNSAIYFVPSLPQLKPTTHRLSPHPGPSSLVRLPPNASDIVPYSTPGNPTAELHVVDHAMSRPLTSYSYLKAAASPTEKMKQASENENQ
jgi:hypothetical protein